MRIVEGELEFEFPDPPVAEARRLDRNQPPDNVSPPVGMSVVDLVVEEANRTLLVEISDFPIAAVAAGSVRKSLRKFANLEYVEREAVPKARDSYAYLHLMEQDSKPFLLVIVLGLDRHAIDRSLLTSLMDAINHRLRREGPHHWKRQYIERCVVLTESGWNSAFPAYPLRRA